MKKRKYFYPAGCVTILLIVLQACAGPGQMNGSGSWKSYSRDYEKMKSVVQQAIKSSSLGINYVNETDSKDAITIIFARRSSLGNEKVQKNQGKAFIQKTAGGKSRIRIENPEYHFSVPDYQREDYRRKLYTRIDDLLGE